MKKFLVISAVLCLLSSFSTVFAEDVVIKQSPTPQADSKLDKYLPYKSSERIARTEVPASAVLYGYKKDNNIDKLKFRDNATYTEYEAKVDTVLQKLVELEIHGSNIPGSTTVRLSAQDIQKIILEAYPDATNIKIEQEKDGNNTYYEADFTITKGKVEAKLNPMTGAFGEREIEFF